MKRTIQRSRSAHIAAMLAVLAFASGPAGACGFHGGGIEGLTISHPRSLDVAFAVQDAVTAGLIDKGAVTDRPRDQAGYLRNVMRLDLLRRRLVATKTADMPAMSVLLVDSKLWARLTPNERGLDLTPHTEGPDQGDVVLVTHETVLIEVLERRMPIGLAVERRLLILDAGGAPTDALATLLTRAMSIPKAD